PIKDTELFFAQPFVHDESYIVAHNACGGERDLGRAARAHVGRSQDDLRALRNWHLLEPMPQCGCLLLAECRERYVHVALHVKFDDLCAARFRLVARHVRRALSVPHDPQHVRPFLLTTHLSHLTHLVIALGRRVAERGQQRRREHGFTVLAFGAARADATGRGQQLMHERTQVCAQLWKERVKLDRYERLRRDDQLRVAALTSCDDLSGRALNLYGRDRQRIADAEPSVLGAMLALEDGVAWTASSHQSGTDVCDHDAILHQLRTQTFGQTRERKLARAVRHKVRDTNTAADG